MSLIRQKKWTKEKRSRNDGIHWREREKREENEKKNVTFVIKANGQTLTELLLSATHTYTMATKQKKKKIKRKYQSRSLDRQTILYSCSQTMGMAGDDDDDDGGGGSDGGKMERVSADQRNEIHWKILDFSIRHKNYIIQAQIHCKVSMPIACAMSAWIAKHLEMKKARQGKAIK